MKEESAPRSYLISYLKISLSKYDWELHSKPVCCLKLYCATQRLPVSQGAHKLIICGDRGETKLCPLTQLRQRKRLVWEVGGWFIAATAKLGDK